MQFFRLCTAQAKVHQIPHVIFQTKSQFFFKVCIFFQCHERSFFSAFLDETLYAIDKNSTSKCKFSDLPLLILKFTKFASLCSVRRHETLYVLDKKSPSMYKFSDIVPFLKPQGQDLFKFSITVQCHGRKLLYIFLAQTSYTFGKNSPSK